MKRTLYLLICLSVLAWTMQSCSDDNKAETPPTSDPEISFPAGSETQPVFATEGGTSTLTFTASEAWTASVGEANTRAIDWLTVSPTSGQAGTATLTITTEPNTTYDERNAAIILTSGSTRKTLTVTQKQQDALTVTSNKVELDATGGEFSIELQSNITVSYEIAENAQTWLTPASDTRALTTTTLRFQAATNEDLQPRQGVITLSGGDGLTEEVTVYQAGSGPVLILTQKEYLVGSDGETIQVELKSNNTYQIEMPSVDWITTADTRALSTYTHYFTIAPNDTYDAREAVIRFVDRENGLEDSVKVTQVQRDAIILAKNHYDVEPEGNILNLSVSTNVDFAVNIAVDWIKSEANTRGLVEKELTFIIEKNTTDSTRTGKIRISHNKLEQIIQITQKSYLAKQQREALIALYKATDGDNWHNNTNWCSDKPIYEWYGVNHCYGDWTRIQSDCVQSLHLDRNNLRGELPEETSTLMDLCHRANPWYLGFNLAGNYIHGEIPASVRNHPNWWELGWDIISQDIYGGGIELQDYGLKIDDKDITIKNNGEKTTVYQLLAQNELTLVYNLAAEACINTKDLTQARVNMHLDYCNKGLATVYCFRFDDETLDKWMNENVPHNLPEGIYITTDFGNRQGAHYPHGNIYLYDKHGNLVYHLFRVYDLEADNEELYNHKVDSVLRSHLGEPEEHPLFEMENYYTSSDYSKDGEVFTLQKATKGKGIDLVFMGDAFVDKDMEPNGLYEQMMEAGMEKLFSIEPYKSLRDRFNVYSVKVVSPNNLILPGTTTAIQGNDQICFEYARKIPELNTTQMMICVIYSTPYFNSSTTMYQNDGSFVAYIRSGDISDVLIHEVGGHGIAKLMDEYVNAEYENQTLPESEKETMDYEWENFGWGANVDWRNNPATVRWSRFLQDDRYSNEGLGLYEGAYLYSFGAYRPTENSMMRYNDSPFNAPSREQIYKTVMQMSEGSSWTYDYEDFVEFDAVSRNAATTRSLRQAPSAAQVEKWKKSHRPPVRMKGTWRDARKESIAVPYR